MFPQRPIRTGSLRGQQLKSCRHVRSCVMHGSLLTPTRHGRRSWNASGLNWKRRFVTCGWTENGRKFVGTKTMMSPIACAQMLILAEPRRGVETKCLLLGRRIDHRFAGPVILGPLGHRLSPNRQDRRRKGLPVLVALGQLAAPAVSTPLPPDCGVHRPKILLDPVEAASVMVQEGQQRRPVVVRCAGVPSRP